MKTIERLLEELAAKWQRRCDRRRAIKRATATACRIALNGCRM